MSHLCDVCTGFPLIMRRWYEVAKRIGLTRHDRYLNLFDIMLVDQ